MNDHPFVMLRDIKKYYPVRRGVFLKEVGTIKAVDGVNLTIRKGETLGLVGESGCGKSTLGRVLLRIEEPSQGEVYLEGENISRAGKGRVRDLRREMQIIFQDPYSSLNPRMTVSRILAEPFIIHGVADGEERKERILKLIAVVGLRPEHLNLYPRELSGGQRQRVGIARALALRPSLIVADEPISSLDVSIQAQILNLLRDLQGEFGLTYLFISHDLRVVEHVSDRVAVMYLGKIVELADGETLYDNPIHPYSEALLSAVCIPNPTLMRKKKLLEGDVPSAMTPPPGCHFHTRCPLKIEICSREEPPLNPRPNGSWVACHVR
jgi:oligopeptide transport system ATP-binding protein